MKIDGLGDLPIFPCRADKRPLVKAWPSAARHIEPPNHWLLVGMPTGSVSGIWCLISMQMASLGSMRSICR